MPGEMADSGKKLVTLDDLIDALDKRERAPSNVPKVDTFHFKGERVSDWLDLTEQELVGLSDEVKLQRVLRYVLHSHHQEVGKVVDAANGSWARFRDMMQRKYRLGDGLLTMADLEAINKDDFSTIGAFVHEFKRKAQKVHGISEETQCAIFLGLLTGSEASELTGHGGGNEKLTWATIDKAVEEGSLDQVEQHQVRLQRRKRKERDATAFGTPGVKRIVTDVLAALGYDNEAKLQKRGVTVAQGRASGAVEEEARREDYGGEETGSQILTKAKRKQRNLQAARTKSQNKVRPSQEPSQAPSQAPPRKESEPGRRKEVVEVPEEEEEDDDEEDVRLRQEEDQRAELGAKKRGGEEEAEPSLLDNVPKRKKYAVRMEEGFDVERMVDKLLEGHNDLMNLKDILASAPRLRRELKGLLSRRLVPNIHLSTVLPREVEWTEAGTRMDWKYVACGVDPTALACSLKNYTPSDPTVARWLTYIWMFNFELERISGNKNRADGLSRINWDGSDEESIEDTPPVDGFLDQEEDVRLHINEWSLRVPSCVSHPVWLAPKGYEQKEELVLKPFQEEDLWGSKDVGWMMKLVLAGTHSLVGEVRAIEEGPTQVEEHEQLMGGMYLLTNTLLQGDFDRKGSFSHEENEILVSESRDDEFEEGEIKEAFRAEEYDGIYWELGLLLSCEMRDRDASVKAQKMRHLYVVRDGHLFIKRQVGNPRRIICGRNRQIDIIAALHDGIAGGHKGVSATCAKISELYHWDRMMTMVIKYCRSCIPCQERSAQRPREPLHPRLEREVGAVVHLDLLFMPAGENGCNYIFDARDNLTGFVDGRAIRTKTDPLLANYIEQYYLRYPFVREFVMDRGSEFTCNERGGRGARPQHRPQGALGGDDSRRPVGRESTPIFDDGNIELFLDSYEAHATREGWSTLERIRHLRGVGRFEKPIAHIREEALAWQDVEARMQMLRVSPMGPDGLPIRLEEGNAEEFIPAYEQYMCDQGTGQEEWMQMLPLWTRRAERSLARQIRDRAHDWEDCQAQLRQAFRRLEPERPETRVERRQRKRGEAVPLRTPLDRLEAHLDASQWGASQLGADQSGPARYEPVEDEPEEEPPEPGPEAGSREAKELQTEGVITVGDDTLPHTPILEQARQYWPEGIPEPDSEEMLGPPPEATTPPPTQAEPEGGERARTPTTVAPQLTESTGARMDVEVPTSGEPPPGPPPAEERTSEEDPLREGHEARTGRPPGETKEEKRARVQVRLEELYQEKLRMEAAGEAPKPPIDPPTSEQKISAAWASYESERDAPRLRSREVGQGSARLDEARETEDMGFSAAGMEMERTDRRIGEVAISSFQRYSMLSDELAASRLEVGQLSSQLAEERVENQAWRTRMEAKEAEWEKRLQDMAAIVERLSTTKVVDWTEQSRYGIQGKKVQGLFGQEGTTEMPQQEGMGKVFLDPAEVAARREAEERRFSFRTPTELASRRATPMTVEGPEDEPAQRPQPPVAEGGPTEEFPTILLEVQEGALTGGAASTETEVMGGEASRLDELVAAMELDMPSGGPQRQETPEPVPEIGELRTQLGYWATGADSGEHISEQQQEVMSEPATTVTPQPSDLHRDEEATAMGGVRKGRPLRLDTPAYRPEGGETLAGPSTQMMEAGPVESWSMPQSHEMSKETSETSPLPGSQKKKRRCRGRSDDQCFFCKDGVHRALECPKFLKDKAAGRVTESSGRMYDRQGRVVERAPDGGRAQLYRQNQEAMSE
ncbi:hypothetical protein CBR_g50135 [Chara braunii]|uniref:Integrase zinc-binding domain-containing protein n=1 Tax=Chara braunii TaxID=69332 RepID=A0A388M6E4_CHABU|nr:hypothetical protein CBR_g50135 [Chara braunii]|eukprot:GBG90042.1 hypothetical protein CBR_g50135 [Chara braunii]